jgi:hypothetical protein
MTNIVLIAILSILPGVSWAGHLGGGLTGALISIPLNVAHFDKGVRRWLGWGGTGLAVVVVSALFVGLLGQRGGSDLRVMQKANHLIATNVKFDPNWPGDDKAKEVAAKYRKTKTDLEAVLARLQERRPTGTDEVENCVQSEIALLELVIPYCERMANALGAKEKWTDKELKGLQADFQHIKSAFERQEKVLANLEQGGQDGNEAGDDKNPKEKSPKGKGGKGGHQLSQADRKVLNDADERAKDAWEIRGKKLIRYEPNPWPSNGATLAKQYREDKKKLAEFVAKLKKLGPLQQAEQAKVVETALAYLEAVTTFCEKLAAAIESEQTWTEKERSTLREDFRAIQPVYDAYKEAQELEGR